MPSTFSADDYVKQLLSIYEGAEQQCFALIAKYGTQGRDAPEWLARRTGALQRMKREVQQIVDQLDGQSGDLVRRAVEQAHRDGWNAAIRELDELGEAGLAIRPSVEAIAQLAQTAVDAVQATHLRILRETMNLAQQILGAGAQDVLQGSLRAATAKTVGEAMTGTLTRRTASQLLLDRIADAGITGFVDKAGRAWQLSSYVEMAVRSATAQATVQGKLNAYAERGHDLVIVSDSPEECRKCRYWEGRVLSISGQSHEHPSVDMAVNSGLFHPNCTHTLHAYIEGMTRPMKRTGNPKGYEDRVRQRAMERNVRKWKRREAMAMDDATRAKARAKVKEWQGKLREFTKAKGRPRLYYREQLMGARPIAPGKLPPKPKPPVAPEPPPAPPVKPPVAPEPLPPIPEAAPITAVTDDVVQEALAIQKTVQKRTVFDIDGKPEGTDLRVFIGHDTRTKGGGIFRIEVDTPTFLKDAEPQRVLVRVLPDGTEQYVTTQPLTPVQFAGFMERGRWTTQLPDYWRLYGATDRAAAAELKQAISDCLDDLMPRIPDTAFPKYVNLVEGELRPHTMDRLVGLYLTDPEAFAAQAPDLFLKVHAFMRKADDLIRRVMPDGDWIQGQLAAAVSEAIAKRTAKAAAAASPQLVAGPRPVGSSWREIDACNTTEELDDWLRKNWNCEFRFKQTGQNAASNVSLEERKRALHAVADEMDRAPFELHYIEPATGDAAAWQGGHAVSSHFGVNWRYFSGLNEGSYPGPESLAQKIAAIERNIDDTLAKIARWEAGDFADLVEDLTEGWTEAMRASYVKGQIAFMKERIEDFRKAIQTVTKEVEQLRAGGYDRPRLAQCWTRLFGALEDLFRRADGTIDWKAQDAYAIMIHEIGHSRYFFELTSGERYAYEAIAAAARRGRKLTAPSQYGFNMFGSKRYPWQWEHFAECYHQWRMAAMTGDLRYLDSVPQWAYPFLEKTGGKIAGLDVGPMPTSVSDVTIWE